MKKSVALILAKSTSTRLPNKNNLDFHGQPMFLVNVKKCLKVFDKVFVSSDSKEMLEEAEKLGAFGILRGQQLCGDMPNIPVYRHALSHMGKNVSSIVAVQANSPTINIVTIEDVKNIIEMGFDEVMTCHKDYSIYGSIWALSEKRLKTYGNYYEPHPDVLVVDKSIDIHTEVDYLQALAWQ